jgi:L-alanine-DL-glutamate epimerase-like enolase superfamily enzyme
MKLIQETRQLKTRWPWRIARGVFSTIDYAYVRLEHAGLTGRGEAAHNSRYGETLESVQTYLSEAAAFLINREPKAYHALNETLATLAPGQQAAKAAIDIALLDLVTQSVGLPLVQFLGLDTSQTPVTSYSIGIDAPDILRRKLAEAEDFPILKVKMGSTDDSAILKLIRSLTDKPIRVDANEGWSNRETAIRHCSMLEKSNVEIVEQPMPARRLEDLAWLRERTHLPLIADEDLTSAKDLLALADVYDGVNIKVMKVGGLQPALHLAHTARSLGLKVMLGCMIESSLGITAAAHLSPLADWVDLDGCLLLQNDPFQGLTFDHGQLTLPLVPGVGAALREKQCGKGDSILLA